MDRADLPGKPQSPPQPALRNSERANPACVCLAPVEGQLSRGQDRERGELDLNQGWGFTRLEWRCAEGNGYENGLESNRVRKKVKARQR
jgi:hypothetical protein